MKHGEFIMCMNFSVIFKQSGLPSVRSLFSPTVEINAVSVPENRNTVSINVFVSLTLPERLHSPG